MDIRDILKSFDQLTEGDSTVHKAGPGGYGNRHGSEDVTDQYGKPIGRASLSKMNTAPPVKRGKGRPPKNADASGEVKSYDSSALSKAMGMGKAPKPSGKPSVKHSLKEYFDQMDRAVNEAGLAVQPMPATAQQQQQKAMASKPAFMIKDPANPNMPAITTQDPAVVQAAKSGTMSMQKPGAAPTTQPMPGATPAAGAGSQVAPMKETGDNWIKDATKNKGAFTSKAKSHGMTPAQFRSKVLAHKEDYPAKTEKQAQLAKTLSKMHEADSPQYFAQSSPLSTTNRDVLEGKKGVNPFAKKDTKKKPDADKDGVPDWADKKPGKDDNEGKKKGAAPKKGVNPFAKKTEKKKVKEGMTSMKNTFVILDDSLLDQIANMNGAEVDPDAGTVETWDENTFNQLNAFSQKNPTRLKRTQSINTAGMRLMARPVGGTASGPEYNLKEGMEHHLQAARLEGKSHALRKMPYNCSHDDMEEARHYHDGFKEGLDECYGQMPILGRTAVDEMGSGPEVDTMASYGADDMGMDEGNAFTAGLAKTPHGGKFKVGGSTFTDRTRHDSNLDEFAFESLDKQLNSLLESEEKVSEGMTVSISKGQQGSPDSVSVSAQDGEADQLLSIIKSAGMGLFGGEEQNGYGAPQGTAGAHGGINVVDDHDGMMALMKKLSGGEMQNSSDYADEEGSEEGHMHGEETCNECGGMMEENHQCESGQQVVDEVESEDQMTDEVAEANAPDSGADNTNADVAGNAAANSALATADAGQDEEEGEVYSSPTNEAEDEDETGQLDEISQELAVKTLGLRRAHGMDGWGDDEAHRKADATEKRVEKKFGKDAVAAADKITDKELYGDRKMKEETVAESFANLYKKLAFLSEESIDKEEDEKAEKAGKKVAKDIEYDEGHKGKDDNKAEEAGKKVKKDIEYDDKKDKKEKKLDEWANEAGKNGTDASFEADIDFMTKVISGGLNKQKSTGQATIPVINGQTSRMGVDGLGSPMKESTDLLKDYLKLSGL